MIIDGGGCQLRRGGWHPVLQRSVVRSLDGGDPMLRVMTLLRGGIIKAERAVPSTLYTITHSHFSFIPSTGIQILVVDG